MYRGKCDLRNIIGVVLGKTPEKAYKIGVKTGILKGTYMRNAFAVCPRKHIAPDDLPTESVSIRAVTKEFFTAIANRAVYSASRRHKCKKITEFATAVVITVQNIPARTNKKIFDRFFYERIL